MAAPYSVVGTKTAALAGATAEKTTLTGAWRGVEIVNLHATQLLTANVATTGVTAAVVDADETLAIAGTERIRIMVNDTPKAGIEVSIIGTAASRYHIRGVL